MTNRKKNNLRRHQFNAARRIVNHDAHTVAARYSRFDGLLNKKKAN